MLEEIDVPHINSVGNHLIKMVLVITHREKDLLLNVIHTLVSDGRLHVRKCTFFIQMVTPNLVPCVKAVRKNIQFLLKSKTLNFI